MPPKIENSTLKALVFSSNYIFQGASALSLPCAEGRLIGFRESVKLRQGCFLASPEFRGGGPPLAVEGLFFDLRLRKGITVGGGSLR